VVQKLMAQPLAMPTDVKGKLQEVLNYQRR
jgi:hypothetical protein